MEFVMNDVNDEDCVAKRDDETHEQAVARWKKWKSQFVIGEPQATERHTVEQLKAMGIVGLYKRS